MFESARLYNAKLKLIYYFTLLDFNDNSYILIESLLFFKI